jgi:hypothetical protein
MSICTFVEYRLSAPLPVELVRLYDEVHQQVLDGRWELRKSELTDMAGAWLHEASRLDAPHAAHHDTQQPLQEQQQQH